MNFGETPGSSPAYLGPCVVIQNNVFNKSRINTVVVCAITSNLRRAEAPGNILLHKKEANLPKKSVVNASQIYTVDKSDLEGKIGSLTRQRLYEILNGVRIVIDPKEID